MGEKCEVLMGQYLYKEIKDYLTELITANKHIPNYRLPSENQLAIKFSTTRITAKRALEELQDEGYIYRVHGKGSFISPEATERSELKGKDFICVLLPNIESLFIATLVDGIRQTLRTAGFHLIILSESVDELNSNNLIKRIVNLGIKGIIVFPNSHSRYNKDLLLLALNKFPVVFIDRTLHDFDVSSVTSDHNAIGKKATKLLFDRECKHVGFISMPAEYSSSVSKRITGYEQAHIEEGVRILPEQMLFITKQDKDQVARITEFFRKNPNLDGLLTYGGSIGYNVYRAILKEGISVPQQLKVIFFDDEYAQYEDLLPFSPTCVSQRSTAIGQKAAELILGYITNHSVTIDKILIDCDIIERESTLGNETDI